MRPKTVTHPGTNRARRGLTWSVRRHAASQQRVHVLSVGSPSVQTLLGLRGSCVGRRDALSSPPPPPPSFTAVVMYIVVASAFPFAGAATTPYAVAVTPVWVPGMPAEV